MCHVAAQITRNRQKSREERGKKTVRIGNRRVLGARGVASLMPIERLSERVNIFLNTKHMHILWGPMCVSYPEIYQPYLGARAHARGPGGAPPSTTRVWKTRHRVAT